MRESVEKSRCSCVVVPCACICRSGIAQKGYAEKEGSACCCFEIWPPS